MYDRTFASALRPCFSLLVEHFPNPAPGGECGADVRELGPPDSPSGPPRRRALDPPELHACVRFFFLNTRLEQVMSIPLGHSFGLLLVPWKPVGLFFFSCPPCLQFSQPHISSFFLLSFDSFCFVVSFKTLAQPPRPYLSRPYRSAHWRIATRPQSVVLVPPSLPKFRPTRSNRLFDLWESRVCKYTRGRRHLSQAPPARLFLSVIRPLVTSLFFFYIGEPFGAFLSGLLPPALRFSLKGTPWYAALFHHSGRRPPVG